MKNKKPILCAYYFPNWHPNHQNDTWHGTGWTEWEVLKHARPRFPGHKQPKIPLWGYEDESDPEVMARKISTASAYGIDGFIFDWYWYDEGPYRIRCLDEGFLQAPNHQDMKYSVMWCNHDARQVHPGSRMFPGMTLCPGKISLKTFVKATDHCIEHYFHRPNYLRLDGGLYFSIYNLNTMIESLGGIEPTRDAFDDFRRRVRNAGLGELNLNVITGGIPNHLGQQAQIESFLDDLGIRSRSLFSWNLNKHADTFPFCDYWTFALRNIKDYESLVRGYKTPLYPTLYSGWDVSPRAVSSEVYERAGYPFTPILSDNTPEQYEKALRYMFDFMTQEKAVGNMLTLHSWNEWTEGTYLEPDVEYQYAYLDAIKRVFKG